MEIIFIIMEVLGICVIFFTLGLLLKGDGSSEQRLMGYFITGALIQNAGYLLELTSTTLEAALTATKMQYLGSIFVPLCYCWFIFLYCYEKPPLKLFVFLAVIDLCLLVLIFVAGSHSFYYRELGWLVTESGHHYLDITYGPGYPAFLIFGCAIPYILSVRALARASFTRREHGASRRYKTILALSLLPVFALISYTVKLTYVYDPTPVVMGVVLSMVVILIWGRKDYDFRRLAADTVLYNMSDGVLVLDEEKRIIVYYNPAVAEIFPGLKKHVAGDKIRDVKDFPANILSINENTKMEFALADREYESHVKRITDKNGENQGYVILMLDMTETKRYIEEIKRVREQAEQANEAKSEFLANMSHEIRTPMNAIVGLSDIITEESRGRKVYGYACDIKSASQNLLAIINDILDLSKVEAGKMELVLMDYFVKGTVDEVMGMMDIAASQHGLLLKCEYDMTIPCRYYGDPGRIKQILINLLNNAIKFTKEGYVKISISGMPGDEPDIENLCFCVEDTGCGIKEEDLKHIFEDFKQVDARKNRSVEGTGLGLSITKHLVHLMGGTIHVESTYGAGSVFTVMIPQKIVDKRTLQEMPDIPVKEENQPEMFTAKDYKVLVVDDNLINRKVAVGFLKSYEFDLAVAASGSEAIEMVNEKQFDLIFMDHMMPEMDGIEATGIIRKNCGGNGDSPVIIALTANAMEGVREKFLENGFQDFIPKPLDKKQLNQILSKWVPNEYKMMKQTNDADGGSDGFEDISIAGIDIKEARNHYSGDVDGYQELLQLYCMDSRHKLDLLKKLMSEKDYKTYEIEVHGLKSASANLGAMALSAQAKEHEEAAKCGDEEFIVQDSAQFFANYEKQIRDIQEYLDNHREIVDFFEERQEIDKTILVQMVKEALRNLKKFRSRECANKIKELLKYRVEADTEADLKEIQEQLKLYEDDVAEQLLRDLVERLEKED